MRFAFFAITAAIAVVAQPSAPAVLFNPPPSVVEAALAAKYQTSQSNPTTPEPLTNAKRFAAGLPPLNPRSRHRHRAPHGGSKIDTARRSSTSPLPPLSKKCNIQVTDAEGASLGFISPTWNEFGEYSTLQPDQTGALEVSFSYTVGSTSQLILSTENGPDTALPLFGAIVGYASSDNDIGPENHNYAYLGGTVSTAPGSPPVSASELGLSSPSNSFTAASGIERDIESAIWTYDPVTDGITAQWINTDGSAPATYISIFNGIFVLTGDVDEFAKSFGVPTQELLFSCVTPVAIAQPV